MIAIDTETTGKDLRHGAMPFFFSYCKDGGPPQFYEWDVDPLTRRPHIPDSDYDEIIDLVLGADGLVLQNAPFDVTALSVIRPEDQIQDRWPWGLTHDTLLSGHLLNSNSPHDLTSMVLTYRGVDIGPLERKLKDACVEARRVARSQCPAWRLAAADLEDMPSAKETVWKYDTWLPRALAKEFGHRQPDPDCVHAWTSWECQKCGGHQWWVVLSDYGAADPFVTYMLWQSHLEAMGRRKLLKIYEERRRVLPIVVGMQDFGITLNSDRLDHLFQEYVRESENAAEVCRGIASSYTVPCDEKNCGRTLTPCLRCNGTRRVPFELNLPKSGVNKSLREFCFGKDVGECPACQGTGTPPGRTDSRPYLLGGVGYGWKKCPACGGKGRDVLRMLDLPVVAASAKTGEPSLDKNCLESYEVLLPQHSRQLAFVRNLRAKRKRDTAIAYMEGYRKFWKPWVPAWPGAVDPVTGAGWYVLHPSLNQTGTKTLRWSSSNPNEQNISKQEGFNLRYLFGPAPGREWWSMDAKNIELRIPAYESMEPEMVNLFERPDDAPYYGSIHLLNFHTVYPDIWEKELREVGFDKVGPHCKKKYAASWYQFCKNGGFCVPMNTSALTRQGWKSYDELTTADEVLGYDKHTGKMRWTRVLEKLKFTERPLIEIGNERFRAVTTPEHEWVGRAPRRVGGRRVYSDNFCRSNNISKEQIITLSAPVEDDGILQISADEAALIGFTYGDGSIEKSLKGGGPARGLNQEKVGFRVRLWQTKRRGLLWLDELLLRSGKTFRKRKLSTRSGYVYELDPDECRDLWKRAGLWENGNLEQFVIDLGAEKRKAFLDGAFEAEGCTDKSGVRSFGQNAGPFANAIYTAIFMGGKFPLKYRRADKGGRSGKCTVMREGRPYVTGQRIATKELPGLHEVWCIRTDLDSWVIRQGDRIMLTGNCKQYGGQEELTDATFRRAGAFRLIESRLDRLSDLNRRWVAYANRYGYVETIPDRTVDPERGYPIVCVRGEHGKVKPTEPFNYRVQGSAMWWTQSAMLRCQPVLEDWNKRLGGPPRAGYHMIMQVHDELVFDFPRAADPRANPKGSNLWRAREIAAVMAKGGSNFVITVPTPVNIEYHPDTWSEGITFSMAAD